MGSASGDFKVSKLCNVFRLMVYAVQILTLPGAAELRQTFVKGSAARAPTPYLGSPLTCRGATFKVRLVHEVVELEE